MAVVCGRAKTQEFRDRLAKGEGFDDIIEEAFAVVREAAWRVLELRHYDVQVFSHDYLDGVLKRLRLGALHDRLVWFH